MHEISRSGLIAAQTRVNASARNTANVSTDKFNKQRVTQNERPNGGANARVDTVELSDEAIKRAEEMEGAQNNVNQVDETVERIESEHSFKRNVKAIQTQDQMDKTLLDALGK